MSDTVIKVENLSKKYVIGHQRTERYQTFRDTMVAQVKGWGRRLAHPFRNSEGGLIAADEKEEFYALKDVSFEVKRGDRVGIIGRNGAGKSTLLKILSRITEPTSGRVEIDGRVASLLEVGTGFHPELTGRENIFLNGAILGMTRTEIKRKFDEIVAFAEIEKFLDTPVKRYSSGMYVRLAFAVAAHLEPEILIVDEVLAVGDAQFQKKCLGKMEEVGKEGRTVLFVSHNMAAVQRLCSAAMLLERGTLVQTGRVDNVVPVYVSAGGYRSLYWEADTRSDKDCYFTKVFFVDSEGKIAHSVKTGGSVRVCMEFTLTKTIPSLQLGACLMDDFGGQIFGSAPQDAGSDVPTVPGRYRAIVEFPRGILLAKPYSIKAVLWAPKIGVFDSVEGLNFLPVETASLANQTVGGRGGVIALRCAWSLNEML